MASCITFQTVTVFSVTAGNTTLSIPVLTNTSSPNSCALLAMTGAEYQTLNNGITQANTNSTNAVNTANGVNALATQANTNATAAKTTATTANTNATTALTTAQNAMAQANAISNITQGLNTFNQVFDVPNSTMLAQAWSVGFVLPMTIGLVSFAVASLVNFWRS